MKQGFTAIHFEDNDGNPYGGHTYGTGFAIAWQKGPLYTTDGLLRLKPNGAFVEDIIDVVINRLKYYQGTKFACNYNEYAIAHLEKAQETLEARTADREERKVEGTHKE